MTDVLGIVSLLEGFLEEIRVTRSRRTPSRIRLKRKRYYRRRKARLKRLAKRRRTRPVAKRLAKRRAAVRKRMHIRPGSRKRIRLVSSMYESEGSLMSKNTEQLIRGFMNASKLAECLSAMPKQKPVKEEKEFDEWTNPILPDFDTNDAVLDEEFARMFGITEDAPVATDEEALAKIQEDAQRMISLLKEGTGDEEEAHQVLIMMAEHMDKTVEEVLKEDFDEEEFVTIYFKPSVSSEKLKEFYDDLDKHLGREISIVGLDKPSLNIYTVDPEIVADAIRIVGKENVEEVSGLDVEILDSKIEPVQEGDSARVIINDIMALMDRIEKQRGKKFYEIDSSFERDIFHAIDSKNVAKLNDVIKKLEAMNESVSESTEKPIHPTLIKAKDVKVFKESLDVTIARLEKMLSESRKPLTEMARQVSGEVAQAFKAGAKKKVGNTHTDGIGFYLHRNEIAKKEGGKLWITDAGWPTITTRERLNAIFDAFGIKGGIHQKAGKQRLVLNGKDTEWDGIWTEIGDASEEKHESDLSKDKEFIGKRYPRAKRDLSKDDIDKLDMLYHKLNRLERGDEYDRVQSEIDQILGVLESIDDNFFEKKSELKKDGVRKIEILTTPKIFMNWDGSGNLELKIKNRILEEYKKNPQLILQIGSEHFPVGKKFVAVSLVVNGKLWKEILPEAPKQETEAVHNPSKVIPGKDVTPETKPELGKSLPGKFVRSGATDVAKKLLKQDAVTESVKDDIAETIALTWAVDGIASESEERADITNDFVQSQMDIMDTVPAALEDAGLSIKNYLDIESAKKLIDEINKEWAGKLTVEELYEEFGEAIPHLIAMQAKGHGVGLGDETEITDFLKEKGVEDFDAYMGEAGLTQAMHAVDDYAKAKGIELKTEDIKKPRVFQTKEQAIEFIKKFVPDIVEPYFVKTKNGYIIKYLQDGFMKTLMEDKAYSPAESVSEGIAKGPGIPDGTGPFAGTSKCPMSPEYEIIDVKTNEVLGSVRTSGEDQAIKAFRSMMPHHKDKEVKAVKKSSVSEERENWQILDWAGNLMFDGDIFDSFDDAEAFLSSFLGDQYDTDRQEYEIVDTNKYPTRPVRYLDPKDPRGGGRKSSESLDDLTEMSYSAIALKPGVKFGAPQVLALRKEIQVPVTALSGEPKILRVGSQDADVLDKAQDIIGRDNVGKVSKGIAALMQAMDEKRLTPAEKKAVSKFIAPDMSLAKVSIRPLNALGLDGKVFDLIIEVPVDNEFLKQKGEDPVGLVVREAHDLVGKRFGLWLGQPTVGKDARAKGGMKSIRIMWHIDDPFSAYAIGANIDDPYKSKPVESKEEVAKRLEFAEKEIRKAKEWKDNARKEIQTVAKTEEEQDKMWQEKYLPDWLKLNDELKSSGLNYVFMREHLK